MINDLDDLRSVLKKFAGEESVQAKLFRQRPEEETEEATGAVVVIGQTEGKRFTELRGLEGEMPANIRIEDDAVFGSSRQKPDDWRELEGPNGDGLRAFSLLDPRTVSELISGVEFTEDDEGMTLIIGRIDLASIPRIPEQLIKFLGEDAVNREIRLRFDDDRLIDVTQHDLFPRASDRIIARFEG